MAEVAGLGVTQQPRNLDAARLFDLFGVGYFWISRDPVTNVPIIKLGMLGNASVVLVCLAAVMMHTVSWQLLILASADLVYAVFF